MSKRPRDRVELYARSYRTQTMATFILCISMSEKIYISYVVNCASHTKEKPNTAIQPPRKSNANYPDGFERGKLMRARSLRAGG